MGITVKELAEFCDAEIKKGNGNKIVYISRDDGGNDFHLLFYGFTSDKKSLKELNDYSGFVDDNELNNVVVLG